MLKWFDADEQNFSTINLY